MGLYPRYAALCEPDWAGCSHDHGLRGAWWTLTTSSGVLVGLCSVAAPVDGDPPNAGKGGTSLARLVLT